MRKLFGPAQIASILLVIAGLIVRQPAVVVLGVAGWVAAAAIASMKETGKRHTGLDTSAGRDLVRPIFRLRSEIQQIVAQNQDNPTVKVIGKDALEEADRLVQKATAFGALLHDSRFAPNAMANAKEELARLNERLAASDNDAQRQAFELAIQAREGEVAHYDRLLGTIEASKARLKEAEAALSAVKAQLAASLVGGEADVLDTEGLSGMVGRLKSLSSSMEEVDEMRQRIL